MASLRSRQWLLLIALCSALGLVALLSVRGVGLMQGARGTAEPIQSWMSVAYVAHSHRVAPAVIWRALRMPPHRGDRRPLDAIAQSQNRDVDEVIRSIDQAIARAPRLNDPHEGPE